MNEDYLYFESLGEEGWSNVSPYDVGQRWRLLSEELIPAELDHTAKVLEIGCGWGYLSQKLIRRFPLLTVNDISEQLCGKVAEQLGCDSLAGDCTQLEPSGSFDLVFSSECIEHTPDPYEAVRRALGMLKPGGFLVKTTPNKLYFPLLVLAVKLGIRKFHGPERWTWPHQMKSFLRNQGIQNLMFSGCHLLPWQIPGSKLILPILDRYGRILYPAMVNYGFRAQTPREATS